MKSLKNHYKKVNLFQTGKVSTSPGSLQTPSGAGRSIGRWWWFPVVFRGYLVTLVSNSLSGDIIKNIPPCFRREAPENFGFLQKNRRKFKNIPPPLLLEKSCWRGDILNDIPWWQIPIWQNFHYRFEVFFLGGGDSVHVRPFWRASYELLHLN